MYDVCSNRLYSFDKGLEATGVWPGTRTQDTPNPIARGGAGGPCLHPCKHNLVSSQPFWMLVFLDCMAARCAMSTRGGRETRCMCAFPRSWDATLQTGPAEHGYCTCTRTHTSPTSSVRVVAREQQCPYVTYANEEQCRTLHTLHQPNE